MGILNKLMFWKKEDDFDFDRMTQQEMGKSPSLGPDPLAGSQGFPDEKSAFGSDPFSPKPTFGQPSTSRADEPAAMDSWKQQNNTGGSSKDIELINSKLDTLKAILTSMDQRLSNVERNTGNEQQKQRLW